MKITTSLYTIYAVIIFIFLCLIYVPIMVLLCQKKSWHHLALKIHTVWAWSFFTLAFIRVEIDRRFTPDPKRQYIYCANHFSYLDIPALFLLFQPKFIGKSSLSKIPLFGYFYRKIHITVNRSSVRSRGVSLKKSKEALDDHFRVAFFPEGGVKVEEDNIPNMVPFRDGAFILSAEKNIPIIPITMPFNYQIVPDRSPLRLHPYRCKIVVHKPVFPNGESNEAINQLKNEVFQVIQNELNAHHQDKVGAVE